MTKTFIIAEAGVNHNGSLSTAFELIKAAKVSGADAVKFQTFQAESLATRNADLAPYQMQNTRKNESQLDMLKKLELNSDEHKEIIRQCDDLDIQFLSSPFDLPSIKLLNELGLRIFKIPSGEINNLPYLRKIGEQGKKIILSTGMSNMDEIRFALETLSLAGTPLSDITVLHCTSHYPAPFGEVNLKAMVTIKNEFKVNIGYSDHTTGIEIPIAAVAMGAGVIEKHFTLNKSMEGPDHQASLEPTEFSHMVSAIRNIEIAMGDGIKNPTQSELENRSKVRKSIVASKQIYKGETFSDSNMTVKRPAHGIGPDRWDHLVGKLAKKNFSKDDIIEL